MCGIAGYVGKKRDNGIQGTIDSMLSTIVHRGPDGSGTYFYENRVGLGHRRLSIIDLTENGTQPIRHFR